MKIRLLREKLIFTALYAALVVLLYRWDVPCLFLRFCGLSCPGCGMTRAYLALMQGDVMGAFAHHPMFWAVPIIYLFILFDGRLFRQRYLNYGSLILLGLGFLLTWLGRIIG